MNDASTPLQTALYRELKRIARNGEAMPPFAEIVEKVGGSTTSVRTAFYRLRVRGLISYEKVGNRHFVVTITETGETTAYPRGNDAIAIMSPLPSQGECCWHCGSREHLCRCKAGRARI